MSPSRMQIQRLELGDEAAREIVQVFGTPLYVMSEKVLREKVQRYKRACEAITQRARIAYASKANSTVHILKMVHQEGCLIDVASEGELRAALMAGIPASDCYLHGNNKSEAEISFALQVGIGHIVVDNFEEIEIHIRNDVKVPIVLRLAPGVDPITHVKVSTGQEDTKFGFNIADGSAEKAVVKCVQARLNLVGFHCHVGSQLFDPQAQIAGGTIISEFAAAMKHAHGVQTSIINVGGGLAIPYSDDAEPLAVEDYCRQSVEPLCQILENADLNPEMIHEPGRALVGEAGVTLYSVGAVKKVSAAAGERTYVVVDGGLADNPRPALYGSKYTVDPIAGDGRKMSSDLKSVTVCGRHCEVDQLFESVEVPSDIRRGDILQVLCTGAYNNSMSSNYNRYPRPATLLIETSEEKKLIQRADSWNEMFAREITLP